MPSPGRRRRPIPANRNACLLRWWFALCTGVALLVALTACGSRPRHSSDSGTQATPASDGRRSDSGALASQVRAREQDILAALPLARRTARIIKDREGRKTFTFEGYFSGRELVCIKALPPPQGDTTSVDGYLFEHGKLLGFTHEMRSGGVADGVPELAVHALFAPDGSTLEFEMVVNGQPHELEPTEREALLRITRSMAKEAYEEIRGHPNG